MKFLDKRREAERKFSETLRNSSRKPNGNSDYTSSEHNNAHSEKSSYREETFKGEPSRSQSLVFRSDIERLVRDHERYDESLRHVFGPDYSLGRNYLVDIRWLNEAARRCSRSIKESQDAKHLMFTYMGLTFIAPKGGFTCNSRP